MVIFLVLAAIIGAVSLITVKEVPVKAASYENLYTLTSRNYRIENDKQFYSAVEGCAYNITVPEDQYVKISRLTFSAYQIWANGESLSKDNEGKITNPIAEGKDGEGNLIDYKDIEVPLVRVEEHHDNGTEKIKFQVTAYEWCAFVFYIEYSIDGTPYKEESEPLYCTNIDIIRPSAAISEGPIFRDNGFLYYVNCRGNALGNNPPSINSGLKKIEVYRILGGTEEVLQVIDTFENTNGLMMTVEVLVVRGTYYVRVTDGVGYITNQKIAQIEYDMEELIRVNQIDEILQKSTLYTDALVDDLQHKYNLWRVLTGSNASTEAEIEEARLVTLASLNACLRARLDYESGKSHRVDVRNLNNFTSTGLTVTGFNAESYPSIKIGETVTLKASFTSMKASELAKDALSFSTLKNPDTVILIDLEIAGRAALKYNKPVVISVSVPKEYRDAEAYALVELDGKRGYEPVQIDKTVYTVNVYATNSHMKIYMVYTMGGANAQNLNYLYLLLILPVGAGIALMTIYFIRRKKTGKPIFGKRVKTPAEETKQISAEKEQIPGDNKPKKPPANKSKKSIKKKK